MKADLQKYFIPLFVYAVLVSVTWTLYQTGWLKILSLFLGLGIGAILLDADHFIYWLLTNRQLQESQLVIATLKHRDFRSLYQIFTAQKKNHSNLIFHHFSFHLVLVAVSSFMFTSTNSIFGKACLLAINWHLLVDIYSDWQNNRLYLQKWFFARMDRQLSLANLQIYIRASILLMAIFSLLLLRS